MRKSPESDFAIVTVKGNRRKHIVRCKDLDLPGAGTTVALCGQAHEYHSRRGRTPIEKRTGTECPVCIDRFQILTIGYVYSKHSDQGKETHLARSESDVQPVCGQFSNGRVSQEYSEVTCSKCRSFST